MKKFLFLLLVLLFATQMSISGVNANSDNKITAVYFYSPTCASCVNISNFLKSFCESHKNLDLKRYDISDLRKKSLLDKYCEAYSVLPEDDGIVPVIFIRDKYYTDDKLIRDNLEKELERNGVSTLELESTTESHERDLHKFRGFKSASVFIAGLVNGINPCSISMLLFLLSLLVVNKTKILKIGLSFIAGKFLASVLLGTILFRFLSFFNFGILSVIMKGLLVILLLILIIMNIQDYFAAKAERYDRIRLQLPEILRGFNHRIIKKISGLANLKIILPISFVLGVILNLGEFLCTGQIYLATIITIFQTNPQFSSQALFYLIIYNVAMTIPLVILTVLIYKGKEIFEVSEVIRERLHVIKIINALILLAIGSIILILF